MQRIWSTLLSFQFSVLMSIPISSSAWIWTLVNPFIFEMNFKGSLPFHFQNTSEFKPQLHHCHRYVNLWYLKKPLILLNNFFFLLAPQWFTFWFKTDQHSRFQCPALQYWYLQSRRKGSVTDTNSQLYISLQLRLMVVEWLYRHYICHGCLYWSCTRAGEVAGDLMLSCLAGCLQCWCDLMLFLIGQAPLSGTKQVAVLTPLVLQPFVGGQHTDAQWTKLEGGQNICAPWTNLGIHEWSAPNPLGWQTRLADEKIRQQVIFFY